MEAIFLFIDGSNFYHTLKKKGALDYFSYNNLFSELSNHFVLEKIFFYDAIKDRAIEPEQYARQQAFHKKLLTENLNLEIRLRKLRYLKTNGVVQARIEKGVDVLLATDLIKCAYENQYQTALLASGDADYVPAVELARELGKKIINIHFYENSSTELRNKCDSHILIAFNKEKLFLKI
jgi:uncharacterized LabA/DUF88 family protein